MPRQSFVITGVFLIILFACILSAGCGAVLLSHGECENTKTVRATYTLTENQPEAELRTPSADKNCHADMKLTYWYRDQTLATSGKQPRIFYDFGTWMGTFQSPAPKQVSPFFDENSVPVTAWETSVNEGAKNEAGEFTQYKVYICYPPDTRDYPNRGVGATI